MTETALFDHFSVLIDLPQNQHDAYFNKHVSDDTQADELKALVDNHFNANEKTQWHELIASQAQDITGDEQLKGLLGTNLGVYTLTEIIGEGGMGIVFLAERNDGMMQQQVAIKFLFPSIVHVVGSQLVHNQAQILARLNHPNITHVYDAGTTEVGLHYVVMEYVAGHPIDEYCREHRLNFNERIMLFLDVCDAITKTHLINIAHSDIKPGNVLVNKDGVVKILDFDIAKTLQSTEQESENESVKRYLRALSLAYASPEQLTGKTLTLATDQYSLAVLLYVLLSEQTPFDLLSRDNKNKAINELVDDIQAGNAKTLVVNPQRVGITKSQQWTMLSDITKVIKKAMSADAYQRYDTVAAFKSDIHKTLKHFATDVNNSPWQRFKKWFIRKPLLAGVYVLALTAGIAITVKNEQILQERNAAIKAQGLAEQEKTNAKEVANQLASIFKQADPTKSQSKELTAKDMLKQGYESIIASTTLSASSKLQLLTVIGESYYGQGQYEEAVKVFEAILDNPQYLTQDIENQLTLSLLLIESYDLADQNQNAITFVDRLKVSINLQGKNGETKKLILLAELASSRTLITLYGVNGINRVGDIVDKIDEGLTDNTLQLSKKELITFKYKKIQWLREQIETVFERDGILSEDFHQQSLLKIVRLSKELIPLVSVNDKKFIKVVRYYSLALKHSKLSDEKLGSNLLINALPDILSFYGEEHPYIVEVYYILAEIQQGEGNLSSSELNLKKLMKLLKLTHGENHFEYGFRLEFLSYVYQLKGDIRRADSLLLESYRIAKNYFYQNDTDQVEYINNYANLLTYIIYHYANTERLDKTQYYLNEFKRLLAKEGTTESVTYFTAFDEYQAFFSLLLKEQYLQVVEQLEPKSDALLDNAELLIASYVKQAQYDKAITLAERHKKLVLSGYAYFYPEYYYQQFGFDLAEAYGKSGDLANAQRTLQEMYDYNFKLNPAPENYWLQRLLRDAKTYGVSIKLPEKLAL